MRNLVSGWWVIVSVVLVGCGQSGAPTRLADGVEGFTPDTAEDSQLVATLPQGQKVLRVHHNPDPDLVLVVLAITTNDGSGPQVYAGRVSTGTLSLYCGDRKANPLGLDFQLGGSNSYAPFSIVGENLVIFTHGGERVVCSKDGESGALVSREAFAAEAVKFMVAKGGIWTSRENSVGAGSATPLEHISWGGVSTATTLAPSVIHQDRNTGDLYLFSPGKVHRIAADSTTPELLVSDLPIDSVWPLGFTAAGIAVAERDFAPATIAVRPFRSGASTSVITHPEFSKGCCVEFANSGNGFMWNGAAGGSGERTFHKNDGSLVEHAIPSFVNVHPARFNKSGFVYRFGKRMDPQDVFVLPLETPSTQSATPTYQLALAQPNDVPVVLPELTNGSATPLEVHDFADGTCLVEVNAGASGISPNRLPNYKNAGQLRLLGSGRSLAFTKCGSNSAKLVLHNVDGRTQGNGILLGASTASDEYGFSAAPFFTAFTTRERAAANDDVVDSRFWFVDQLVSAWTVTTGGEPKGLFTLADAYYLHPATLNNLLITRGQEIRMVKAPKR